MPLSTQHKCIFIHIPKTAGTSMEYALGMHGGIDFIGKERYINQKKDETRFFGSGLQHLSFLELKAKIPQKQLESYFKFTIVRNPWDRLVSHFAWKKGRWIKKEELTVDVFEKEVNNLYKEYKLRMGWFNLVTKTIKARSTHQGIIDAWGNRHLMPQYLYTKSWNEKNGIDFIGKYENLDSAWDYICNQIGVNLEIDRRMISYRKGYREYYSPKTIKIVEEIYQKDILNFNYEF